MKKSQLLINKIEKVLDEEACNDFRNIPGVMIFCAMDGRLFRIQQHYKIIDNYFNYSPEVYDYIKDYSINKLMSFLERIIKNLRCYRT